MIIVLMIPSASCCEPAEGPAELCGGFCTYCQDAPPSRFSPSGRRTSPWMAGCSHTTWPVCGRSVRWTFSLSALPESVWRHGVDFIDGENTTKPLQGSEFLEKNSPYSRLGRR